jgi:hypothetical protein
MKSIFKICMVLLALSDNMYSQNWLWVKSQGINTTNPLVGNTRLTASGNLVTFLAEPGGSHLQFIDANGIVLWSQFFTNLTISDICTDASNNIYFAGTYTTSTIIGGNTFVSQRGLDALIGEFNSGGILIKSKSFGTASHEKANSIALSNNQLYVTGSFINSQMVNSVSLTGNGSSYNTYVLKFDMNFIAQKGIETVSPGCSGIKIAVGQTNSIYLIGTSAYTLSIGTQTTYIAEDGYYFAKLNNNLTPIWLETISNHFMYGTYLPYIYFDVSGNVVLNHQTGGGGGSDYHLRIEKYTSGGNYIWGKDIQMTAPGFADIDNNDNVWVAGRYSWYSGGWFSILKINSAGTTVTQLFYDANIKHGVSGLAVKADNDFYIIGNCDTGSNLNNYTCSPSNSVFMAHYGLGPAGIKDKVISLNGFNIYPNPSSGSLTLKCTSGGSKDCILSIKNTMGQVVIADPIKDMPDQFSKEIDISTQPKGIYFIELQSGDSKTVEKIVFQ